MLNSRSCRLSVSFFKKSLISDNYLKNLLPQRNTELSGKNEIIFKKRVLISEKQQSVAA